MRLRALHGNLVLEMSSGRKPKKRGPGRPPSNQTDSHKSAILDAATNVFMERGFAKASTSEIARRAGASKVTLYSLYPSKVELYIGLLQRRLTNVILPISGDALSLESPIDTTLEEFALRMVTWVTSDEASRLYRLVVAESMQFPELGEALWSNGPERGRAALRHYFEMLVRAERLEIPDTDVAALQFQGMLLGMANVRRSLSLEPFTNTESKLKAWVRQGVAAFTRGYLPVRKTTREVAPKPHK